MALIVEKGLHAVTFADIAKAAKVGIGAIYRRFESKENIVQQIWIEQKKEEANFIFTDFKNEGTVKERFWFLWKRVIQYFDIHENEFYFSYHMANSPILTEDIDNVAMERFLLFNTIFKEGIEQRLFKENLSARQLRLYTFSTINGWLLWVKDERLELTEQRVNQFLQMAWDAIKKSNFLETE